VCGLFGALYSASADVSNFANKSISSLNHRGPDDSGTWKDDSSRVILGHTRLSILDLTCAGHQPMQSECERYMLVFNGEIYNHALLRKRLDKANKLLNWRGHSDTETLLACFSHWGVSSTLKSIEGMFSIALWDKLKGTLVLARDRFGEKPLYYGWCDGSLVFSSELKVFKNFKGFKNKIDRNVLSLYMRFMYVPSPYSIYKDIYKLDPGCLLEINQSNFYHPPESTPSEALKCKGLSVKRWYDLFSVAKDGIGNTIKDETIAIKAIKDTLLNSVESQLISDVPIGAFLSGGVDSSIIVALMQQASNKPVETFSIGFQDKAYNEAHYAKKVAQYLGTSHHEIYISPGDSMSVIPELPNLYDEPFADSSQIPTFLVSKLARQNVTVSLSGDGGDELFGGYNRYLWSRPLWNKFQWIPPSVRKVLGASVSAIPIELLAFLGGFLPSQYSTTLLGDKVHRMGSRLKNIKNLDELYFSLVSDECQGLDVIKNIDKKLLKTKLDINNSVLGVLESEHRMMLWDTLTYLTDDILTKVDRAAMGVGLETRIPFLDKNVVALSWRIPLNMKIRNGESKWILKQLLYDFVPRKLIDRPKAGFAIPVGYWLKGPLREWAEDLLNSKQMEVDGYFDVGIVEKRWNDHLSGKYTWTNFLWSILMFNAWLRGQR
jgi:asparagine synthase (glutamine-hydrolysing)